MKKYIAIVLIAFFSNALATGDGKPLYSGKTSKFLIDLSYAREFEFASGARNDGLMLVVTPQGSKIGPTGNQVGSLYFVGDVNILKSYQATLLAAQAAGKAVTISWGSKWGHYKNVLDDADILFNGWATGYKILRITTDP